MFSGERNSLNYSICVSNRRHLRCGDASSSTPCAPMLLITMVFLNFTERCAGSLPSSSWARRTRTGH